VTDSFPACGSGHFHICRRMDTIIDDLSRPARASPAAGTDSRGWSLARSGRSVGGLEGHHQQDRARRGQPDRCRVLVRLASAFDLTWRLMFARRRFPATAFRAPGGQTGSGAILNRYLRRQCLSPIPSKSSASIAGAAARDAARFVLRAYPSGRLGAVRRLRDQSRLATGIARTGDCLGFGPPAEGDVCQRNGAPCAYVVALARS